MQAVATLAPASAKQLLYQNDGVSVSNLTISVGKTEFLLHSELFTYNLISDSRSRCDFTRLQSVLQAKVKKQNKDHRLHWSVKLKFPRAFLGLCGKVLR